MKEVDEIAAWMREQVAEDKKAAKRFPGAKHFETQGTDGLPYRGFTEDGTPVFAMSKDAIHFLLRHGPRYALEDIEAKELLIDFYETTEEGTPEKLALGGILKVFAMTYMSREGWKEEWSSARPQETPEPTALPDGALSDEDKEALLDMSFMRKLEPSGIAPAETAWTYLVVHPDGSLEERKGTRREIITYLRGQGGDGELGTESLQDFPGLDVAWYATYDLEALPDNPVANHMVRAFDPVGQTLGACRGIAIFTPAFYLSGRRSGLLSGHRLKLALKVHAEIQEALSKGHPPRRRLWPSEMIIASRGLAPSEAWEEYEVLRGQLGPDEKISEVVREHEEKMRRSDPDF